MAILNKTKAQLQEDADAQDDIDLVFEKTMQRKLNALVRVIVNDFAILYGTTGIVINTRQYFDELNTIIKQTYRRVNREFSSTYLNDLEEELAKAKTDEEKDKWNKLIALRKKVTPAIFATLIAWSQVTAPEQTNFVIDTWGKMIRKNVNDAISINILSDLPIDNATIAKQTKKPLTNEMINHNETIAMQEVQTPTENAKFTEADEFNKELIATATVVAIIEKIWITMGDSKVRASHVAANGQKRNLKEPYLVGGELLMYPKDSSLGASLGNIINCRCKSIIT